MFCIGGGKLFGKHILGAGYCLLGIAAGYVLISHEISVFEQVFVFVHNGRALRHCLIGGAYGGEHLVFNVYKFLGLLQYFGGLRRNYAYGIPKIVGNAAHRDHGIPVLFKMAHLYIAGDIRGGKHANHTGQRLCGGSINGQHSGPRILGAHRACVYHALHINIVAVFTVAQHLFLNVHPVGTGAQGKVIVMLRHAAVADTFRRKLYGLDYLYIAGAAADIIAYGIANLFLGGVGINVQQSLGAHHHAGDAEAALYGARLAKGIGINLLFKIRQAFHRDDVFAFHAVSLLNTALYRLAVYYYGTGTACALAAAVLYRQQAKLIPKIAHEFLIFFHSNLFSVYCKGCHIPVPFRCTFGDR